MMSEKRALAGGCKIERRTEGEKTITTLIGHAAVFYRDGEPTTEFDFGYGVERLMRGAFDAALSEKQDVRALWNHDTNAILGRTKSGTLRLSVDDTGLRYDVDLPDTQTARDLAASVERGDIDGSSFSFRVRRNADGSTAEKWEKLDPNKKMVRSIASVDLYDVSPVTFPAYQAASVGIRALDGAEALEATAKEIEARQAAEAAKAQADADDDALELWRLKLRMALIGPAPMLADDV